MMTNSIRLAAIALLLATSASVHAEPLLSISGKSQSAATVPAQGFDLARLSLIGETTIHTKVITLAGEHDVTGVLVRDLIKNMALAGKVIHATALDGYMIEIPIEDVMKYDVVLASKIDGKVLSIRDKGPFWMIYPVSTNPELDDPVYEARSIWQIKSLTVD